MLRLLFVALLAMLCGPATAAAAVECGDPAGPAHHVIAVGVPCSNALAFASTVAERGVTRSRTIGLPGWRAYRARVRRVAAGYDVRAARGRKVIRFQYTVEVAPVDGIAPVGDAPAANCDPNYAGACLNPSSPDYDCAGGAGNGPDYTGTVRVVGNDHFGLDADRDGVGCE